MKSDGQRCFQYIALCVCFHTSLEKVHSSSEGEAVAARTKESSVTIARGVRRGEQLMQSMSATALMTLGAVMMSYGNAGSRRFDNVQRCAIAAEHFHRRPLGQHGNRRRRVRT